MAVYAEMTPSEIRAERRKNRIKNLAILFLTVLLLLTFFSNTIMNYSLPEVAAQAVAPGTVTPRIRGTGTLEADSPYHVRVQETRRIAGAAVREGEHVEKGQVLYYLEDKESSELKDARKELDDLTLAFEQLLFSGDLPDSVITRIRNGEMASLDTYQRQLADVTERYKAAKAADDEAQRAIDALTASQSYTAAQYSYDVRTPDYTSSQAAYDRTQILSQIGQLDALIAELERQIAAGDQSQELKDQLATARSYKATAEQQLQAADDTIAHNTKDAAQIANEGAQVNEHYNQQMAQLTMVKESTARELENVTREREELLAAIQAQLTLSSQQNAISDQHEEIAKLEEKATGAVVEAPVAGVVTKLLLVAGETTSPDQDTAVIQPDGKSMKVSIPVSAEQASRVRPGDTADPQNAWYYTEFKATLESITADKEDPQHRKLLNFVVVSPDLEAGQSVSLVIGGGGRQYDLTVPKNAVREDNNGKFVLVVQSKSGPLGNKYTAVRADVEVLATDETTAALTGALDGSEYVITTATSPVKAGDRIRLSNENN